MDAPIYKITIDELDETTGVDVVSFVQNPAIESSFVALNKQEKVVCLANEDKQILTGAALIPNKQIFRLDENGEPYYIVFDAEVIEKIATKFFREGNIFNTNKEHEEELKGNFVVESWIVTDSEKDKSFALGLELPVGSWVLSYKIPDKKKWEEIKNSATGFSIEGIFNFETVLNKTINRTEMKKANLFEKVVQALKPLFFAEDECTDCKNETEKLGANVGALFSEKIAELSTAEGFDESALFQLLAESAQINVEQVREIVSGAVACPSQEVLVAIASVLEIDETALAAAWAADGCAEATETPEVEEMQSEATPEESPSTQDAETANILDTFASKIKELEEVIAGLEKEKATLSEVTEKQKKEIAELKAQPAAKPVVAKPTVEASKVEVNAPFHKKYLAALKSAKI